MTPAPTVVVAVHDGWYGYGTGAGRCNYAMLQVLIKSLAPEVRLIVMPVYLSETSPEYQLDYHDASRETLKQANGQVEPLDNGTSGMRRFGGLPHFQQACASAARTLEAILPECGPLLVLASDVPFFGLAALVPHQIRGHMVAIAHSTAAIHAPHDRERLAWEASGLNELVAAGGHVAATCGYMDQHLKQVYRLPHSAVVPLFNGLLREEWRVPPPDDTLLPAPARAGFLFGLGRAVPYKGWDDLLDAIAMKPPPQHTVLAAVAEDLELTPYQRHLQQRIHAERLRVTLITRFDPALRSLLAHPALVGTVLPSRVEPFGRIPLEAFVAGAAPVVATAVGGQAELVRDGLTGYSAQPADPASLAGAIQRAISADVGERARLRETARDLAAQHYNYEHNVLAFIQALAPWALRPGPTRASYSM